MMMIGFLVILLALYLAPAVLQITTEARGNVTGMDCANSTISNYDKGACLVSDLNLFYFIGSLLFVGGLIITARVMFGGE